MSSLWTPSGEHFPKKEQADAATSAHVSPGDTTVSGPADNLASEGISDEEAQRRIALMQEQLASTPAEVIVANHCYGLFELAAIYLSQTPPMLFQARLAIDALGYVVEGLGPRLGQHTEELNAGLAQVRMAYVQIQAARGAEPSAPAGRSPASPGSSTSSVPSEEGD